MLRSKPWSASRERSLADVGLRVREIRSNAFKTSTATEAANVLSWLFSLRWASARH